MPSPLICVVDDDELTRTWLCEHLKAAGYAVVEGGTGREALAIVDEQGPALMLLDWRLPDIDGIELIVRLREIDPDIVVVMVTAYGEVETAVRAVKAGAYHFMLKPLGVDDLFITIEKALESRKLRHQVAVLRKQHGWHFANIELVGRSSIMRDLAQTVEKVARADKATVLLQGESGTGKDLIARAIHARSTRSDGPFLEINCSALPEHLVESELFGHERGAFTDAHKRKRGLAEMADGGTLFLDEIGDMAPGTQAKVLRFLENSRFKRVGGTGDVTVDVRVIAATNRDLDRAMEDHTFRSDLYYRLNVVPIHIAPLRDHPEDVEPLVDFFIEKLVRDLKREPVTLTAEAMRVLERYPWPGNVRELRNVIERALILEDTDEIRIEHLPAEIRTGTSRLKPAGSEVKLPPEGLRLEDLEIDLVRQALARTDGNVSQAARLLGLTRDTLRYRLEKYDLSYHE